MSQLVAALVEEVARAVFEEIPAVPSLVGGIHVRRSVGECTGLTKAQPGRFLRRVRRVSIAALVFSCLLSGCPSGPSHQSESLIVFGAASLTDVLTALEGPFEERTGVTVKSSYGATSALARQIEDGAPADVFIGANAAWVGYLKRAGAVEGASRIVARNRLVCATSEHSALARDGGVRNLEALVARVVADRLSVGIADDGVPAGDVARQALQRKGLAETIAPRLVGQSDVRAVLRAVEDGALAAGFVYATDADAAGIVVLFEIDPGLHTPIEYVAVGTAGSEKKDAAGRYLDFIVAEEGFRMFEERGFARP
jgi:molybdate transport system substrate-binding protein